MSENCPGVTDVTIVVRSFIRRWLAERCIASIRAMPAYADSPLVLVDASAEAFPTERIEQFLQPHRVRYLRIPFDSGSACSKNLALAAASTPFVCVVNDDYVFYPNTNLHMLREIFDTHEADIVGGSCYVIEEGKEFLQRRDGTLFQTSTVLVHYPGGMTLRDVMPSDTVGNFFMARVESVQARMPDGWNADLKVQEDVDFFLRAKHAGLRCFYAPFSAVIHDHLPWGPYDGILAGRAEYYTYRFLRKHGLTHYVDLQGKVWKNLSDWPSTYSFPAPDQLTMRPDLKTEVDPPAK